MPMLESARTLGRWDFLSLPLRSLLLTVGADLREVAAPRVGWVGEIRSVPLRAMTSWWRWIVSMPIGQDPLERALVVRGLLAAAHGVDVTDWPIEMAVRPA